MVLPNTKNTRYYPIVCLHRSCTCLLCIFLCYSFLLIQ
nr:MAG TPA: hypothetical protein [Caudoviricetes sp.]